MLYQCFKIVFLVYNDIRQKSTSAELKPGGIEFGSLIQQANHHHS